MKIDSIIKLLSVVNGDNDSEMYRGHGHHSWVLLPSIARLDPKSSPIKFQNGWQDIENYLIEQFKRFSSASIDFKPKSKLEWMVHAQHHGLPTRLLDWSSNPLKALYFTVENEAYDDVDGKVFCLKPRMWSTTSEEINIEKENVTDAFFPIVINNRLRAQEGCFTLFPQRKDETPFDPIKEGFDTNDAGKLREYIIPKEYKRSIRNELSHVGINHMTMFPDLDGISKYIRGKFRAM